MCGLLKVKRLRPGVGTVQHPTPDQTAINATTKKAIRVFDPNRLKILTDL